MRPKNDILAVFRQFGPNCVIFAKIKCRCRRNWARWVDFEGQIGATRLNKRQLEGSIFEHFLAIWPQWQLLGLIWVAKSFFTAQITLEPPFVLFDSERKIPILGSLSKNAKFAKVPPLKAKNGQFSTFLGPNGGQCKLLASSRCAKRALRLKLPLNASFYSRNKIRPKKVKMGTGFAKMGQNPDLKFWVSKGVNLQKKFDFFRIFTKFPKVVF